MSTNDSTTGSLGNVSVVEFGGGSGARYSSRSVAWNAPGTWLAVACSDRVARVVDYDNSSLREVLTITGHNGPISRVRTYGATTVLTVAMMDDTLRLWDVRQATQRAIGKLQTGAGKDPLAVEWANKTSILVVAEKDGTVAVYDSRKLPPATASTVKKSTVRPGDRVGALASYNVHPYYVEAVQFSPDDRFIISGGTSSRDAIGEILLWPWTNSDNGAKPDFRKFPAHTGAIYAMDVSNNGKHMATGGADAIVNLWDVPTVACGCAISRRTKFIRHVQFSPDSRYIATCTEEDGIDVSDASNGDLIGVTRFDGKRGGAEEVAWHPSSSSSHGAVACARTDLTTGMAPAPVALLKFSVGAVQ